MLVESIEQEILSLYSEQKWQDITNLACTTLDAEHSRFFWVLPTIDDLDWMSKVIKTFNISGLASVGCGCGLLEWLFKKYSDLDVVGVELDQSWWSSKYSPPLFLEDIIFIHEDKSRTFTITENYCLLFCYFNNGQAFCHYLQNYRGNLVLVIGPAEGEERTTDPLPFDNKFGKYGWKVHDKKQIGRTKDLIVAYTRV